MRRPVTRTRCLILTLLLCAVATTAASAAAPSRWQADVTALDPPSSNVRVVNGDLTIGDVRPASLSGERTGIALLAPHRLPCAANRITATAQVQQGSAEVQVRGRRPGGWTPWRSAPVRLAVPVTVVQARILLAGQTTVEGVELTAGSVAASPRATPEPAAYRVYATREGLVGGITANGHTITKDDHFVALPSRRGLSTQHGDGFLVKVCTEKKCVTAPVWDVGPWNTHDDYWNAPRELFTELARGMPEAQAAYTDDYNDGLDGFGRQVRNPAGIDLADGTFHDLGLTGSTWVTVTYEWTR